MEEHQDFRRIIMDILKLDWNDYHKWIDKLANKIHRRDLIEVEQGRSKYRYIAGFDPDDIFVAVHISHRLKIPVITDMNIMNIFLSLAEDVSDVIFVSNIVETGNSFQKLEDHIGCSFDTGVLFKDVNSTYNPTFCMKVATKKIYFPWEACGI